MLSDDLTRALITYQDAFGHAVPDEVVEMFATRSGPLMLEIRQAIALQKPVRAWSARSKLNPTLR